MSEKPGGKPRSRGKKNKGRGSGKKLFVTSAEELAHRDVIEEDKQEARRKRRDESDEEGDDESDDDDDVDVDPAHQQAQSQQPKKEALIKTRNPNAAKPSTKVMKAKDMADNVEQKLSRREREAIEKQAKTAAYQRRHLAGETDEAKRDMARLRLVKQRREEAQSRKEEEEEAARAKEAKSSKKATGDSEEDLDIRAIKAMKPALLKESLKDRGLSTQGQKKDLQQRLLDYENEKSL